MTRRSLFAAIATVFAGTQAHGVATIGLAKVDAGVITGSIPAGIEITSLVYRHITVGTIYCTGVINPAPVNGTGVQVRRLLDAEPFAGAAPQDRIGERQ